MQEIVKYSLTNSIYVYECYFMTIQVEYFQLNKWTQIASFSNIYVLINIYFIFMGQ